MDIPHSQTEAVADGRFRQENRERQPFSGRSLCIGMIRTFPRHLQWFRCHCSDSHLKRNAETENQHAIFHAQEVACAAGKVMKNVDMLLFPFVLNPIRYERTQNANMEFILK